MTEEVVEKTLIERAEEQAKRIEEANAKTEELLIRQERLKAQELLGGYSGGHIPSKTPEEEKQDRANKLAEEITNAFKR